jgi:hypothetical protein
MKHHQDPISQRRISYQVHRYRKPRNGNWFTGQYKQTGTARFERIGSHKKMESYYQHHLQGNEATLSQCTN